MSKRIFTLLLALMLCPVFCACGQQAEDAVPTEAPAPAVSAEPAPTPTPAPTAAPSPAATPEPTAEPTPEPTAEPPPEPTPEPTSEPTASGSGRRPGLPDAGLHPAEPSSTPDPTIAQRREKAILFLEKDVEDLIGELGEPLERSYAPSCLGDGEDGILVYEGFTVYTYREGGRETVIDVA